MTAATGLSQFLQPWTRASCSPYFPARAMFWHSFTAHEVQGCHLEDDEYSQRARYDCTESCVCFRGAVVDVADAGEQATASVRLLTFLPYLTRQTARQSSPCNGALTASRSDRG